MRKYCPLIVGIVLTLLLEIMVFNFSTIKSLGSESIDLADYVQIDYLDGAVVWNIAGLDAKIENLSFKVNCEVNSPVAYDIAMTDEGNYYDYFLPQGTIYAQSPASSYINLHPYGKVHSLTIRFSNAVSAYTAPFTVEGIEANVKRPLMFNCLRALIVWLLIVFLWYLRIGARTTEIVLGGGLNSKDIKRQRIITIAVIAVTILLGFWASSSHKLFDEASKPHHQQYKELADALLNGQVALNYVPSEGLVNAPNPYDTIYLQANGIDYRADYAYYEGAYYVYFGIIPELLLYLPYHAITGGNLPNHFAVFAFYVIFVIGVFSLIRQIITWSFSEDKVPYAAYLMISTSIATAPTFAYIFFTADMYSVPIMAALGLTVLGLSLWLHGINYSKGRIVAYILGSMCMAMVAGCRPQLILFSVLAVALFWNAVFKERSLFSRGTVGATLSLILPYVLVAIVVGYYNYARFGSVFDFGATYSLTNNDMNLRGISLSRMLLGLACFLLTPPNITTSFPFLQSTDLGFDYMGRIVTEHYYGGILFMGIIGISIFAVPHYFKELRARRLSLFVVISLAVSIIIGLMDANAAGVLQRYTADMAVGVLSVVGLMLLVIVVKNPIGGMRFLKAGFLVGLFMTLLMICNTYSGITLEYYNPELFGRLECLFRF